jgi:hypothetical protein
VDFVVETPEGLVAVDVKSGATLRAKDRRGLLAFHDEFPDARLVALTDAPLHVREGPIAVEPAAAWLLRVVPGEALP